MIDSANRRGRGRHVTLPATVLLLAALLAGCSDDAGTEPLAGEPADPTPTEADPADEVRAAWDAYWDAVVASENEGEADAETLREVAAGPIVERQLKRVRDQSEQGLRRTGEPEFRDVAVTVEGETARVVGCLDQDGWAFASADGEELGASDLGFRPTASDLELVDDRWLVTTLSVPDDIEC